MATVMTALLGIVVFVDDYFNCLTVGAVMRPVTDKFRISTKSCVDHRLHRSSGVHYCPCFLVGGCHGWLHG